MSFIENSWFAPISNILAFIIQVVQQLRIYNE